MKKFANLKGCIFLLFPFLFGCDFNDAIQKRAAELNQFEDTALMLARENRELKGKISSLEYEIQKLTSKNNYLKIQLEKMEKEKETVKRDIASLQTNDELVNFDTYKWKPDQMYALALDGFKKEKFKESSDYFQAILDHYPHFEKISDKFYFEAGVASYESGIYYDRTMENMKRLIDKYPDSPYYRGAKMWIGLTHLKLGETKAFFKVVEDFRLKYRNTSEWKLLSQHYEKIVQRYK